MVYVGWADRLPANPAIKNVLTNDLFTKVSLFDAGQNTVNTVGYSFSEGKGSKNPYVTVKTGRPAGQIRVKYRAEG
jgi:hypothetical protein